MKILLFLVILLAFLQVSLSHNDILLGNMDTTQSIFFSSQVTSGSLGASVKNAGDFNGDGYADVILGSYIANKAYIIFGKASGLSNLDVSAGLTASQGMVISAANTGEQFGYAVSYAGDVNDDGIDDIIIAANVAQGAKGVVYVIYGSKTPPLEINLAAGLAVNQGFTVTGSAVNVGLGASVSYAGDFNNDKIDDFIIGATNAEGGKGAYYVIFGKKGVRSSIDLASGLGSNEGFMIKGTTTSMDLFGGSASYAGDLDGDGIGDIIIGAYGRNTNMGIAYVIYGKESSAFGTIDLSLGVKWSEGFIIGGGSGMMLGKSVENAGDFNGDGRDDIVIGAMGENSMKGAAYVIFGMNKSPMLNIDLSSALDPSRGLKIAGKDTIEMVGMSVSGAGDVNNDGIDDILIGAPRGSTAKGAAYVIFGSKNFVSPIIVPADGLAPDLGFTIRGANTNDFTGVSVSSAGDVNGDGMPDFVIGANGFSSGKGAAYIAFSPLVCPQKCETCKTGKKCLTCKAGFGLFNDGCTECPLGTELKNGVCTTPEVVAPPPKTSLGTANEVSKGLFDSGSTASRIFTMGRSLSVGLGLIAKIIQNVRFLDIKYSDEALNAFKTYGTDLFELPIPGTLYISPEANGLSRQYARYDMEPSFLENYWDTFMTILISLACFLVVKLVQFLTKSQRKDHVVQVALKNLGQTAANFLIIQIYSNLDDVIFFLVLDISSTKMNSSSAKISLAMGIFFLLFGLSLLIFHCWLLGKYQKEKHEGSLERFEAKFSVFGTLYQDFKDDSAAKQSFFWILIFRCIILVLITMLLQPPWMQAILLMLTNLLFLAYFIYHRPFKSRFDEISQYFSELTVFAAYLSVLILSILDAQEVEKLTLRNGLGKCIVIAGIVLAMGGFVIQIIQVIGVLIGICKFLKNYFAGAGGSGDGREKEVVMLDQSTGGGSKVSESSAILRNTMGDQLELVGSSISRKNRRILPLEKLRCGQNDLEVEAINHDDGVFEARKISSKEGHWVNLPKKGEEEMKEVVAKLQVVTRPLGSRIHRGRGAVGVGAEGSLYNQYVGLTQISNSSVSRRRKIKRNAILPNFSSIDDA